MLMVGDAPSGKLTEQEADESARGKKSREDMPESVFLEPTARKYPVKTRKDGEWKYDRDLLLAAARDARMHGHEELAANADAIRGREFGQAHDVLALDKAANRTIDKSGFMHVAVSNISKATANDYAGREIPGWQELGLDPNRTYKMYRDPDELKKSTDTLNGVPLLNRHIPVNPQQLPEDAIVGAMGKDASFEAPFLKNSLTVWSSKSIDKINSGDQCKLSGGYFYTPDMTPGTYDGVFCDGVMRDIKFNHVSLVPDGRAGRDVVVGDQKPQIFIQELSNMSKAVLSRKAAVAKGALAVCLAPKMLAMDAKLDFNTILAGVTAKNFKAEKPAILARLKTATTGLLAQDATLDDVLPLLDKMDADDPSVVDDDPAKPAMDDDDAEKAFLESMKAKMSPEEHAKLCAMMQKKSMVGDVEETDEAKAAREAKEKADKTAPTTKQAMDAAIASGVAATSAATISRLNAAREAERIVRPYIGELAMAQDDAATVYRMALDHAKVDHKDVKEVASLKAMVQMLPVPGAKTATPRMAQDAAASSDYAKRFPHSNRLVR
jgi:hypothetical protein